MTWSLTDTAADALRVQTELYRSMSPADKLHRVRELTLGVNRLALEGIRARHPDDDEGTLLLRLARRRLGEAAVERAYGKPPGHG